MDYSNYKFRASSFGNLMAGNRGLTTEQKERIKELEERKTKKKELTPKQQETYDKLNVLTGRTASQEKTYQDLKEKANTIIGLTPNMEEELGELIQKRDGVMLSKGAKTYLRKLRREIKFKRRKQLDTKYLTKGIELEEEAIDFLSIYHDRVFTNNKERVEDDYFSGEVDIVEGFDTKCSWEMDTLPDPEASLDAIYDGQNRVYMRLHNAEKWTTSYILLNATKSALNDMIYREGFRWKENIIPMWRKLEILNHYIYDEKTFIEHCELEECVPDLNEYKNQLEENRVEPDLEKSVEIFTGFVEIPDHERIVEKTTYRDTEIEKKMVLIVKEARKYLKYLEEEAEKRKK